jgi:hypothetical protein
MNAILNEQNLRPADLLADLIERHGPWRVVAALAALLLRRAREPRPTRDIDLPDHLRRDIGLSDLPPRRVDPVPPLSGRDNPMFRL